MFYGRSCECPRHGEIVDLHTDSDSAYMLWISVCFPHDKEEITIKKALGGGRRGLDESIKQLMIVIFLKMFWSDNGFCDLGQDLSDIVFFIIRLLTL